MARTRRTATARPADSGNDASTPAARRGRRRPPIESSTAAAPEAAQGGTRQVQRDRMLERIRAAAQQQHLRREGVAGLSMRAIARDIGVVSSAIYRYVPSREELLTLLVADAGASLGRAVTDAEGAVRRGDLKGRFAAVARSLRSWATANPPDYALLSSRPVPQVDASSGVGSGPGVRELLIALAGDAAGRGEDAAPARLPAPVRRDLATLRRESGTAASEDALARMLLVWAGLTGAVACEVSGQLTGVISDTDAWFGHEVDRLARYAGIS